MTTVHRADAEAPAAGEPAATADSEPAEGRGGAVRTAVVYQAMPESEFEAWA